MLEWFGDLFKWKCKTCLEHYYQFRSEWIDLRYSDGSIHKVNICPTCSKSKHEFKVRNLK